MPTYYSQVAMARGGRTLVVWDQQAGDEQAWRSRVVAAWRGRDGHWSAPHRLGRLPIAGYTAPELAMNAHGVAVVTWVSGGQVYVVRRSDSGRWSPERRLSLGQGPAATPEVAVSAAGRAYVVWRQPQHGRAGVLVSRMARSGRWSVPAVLSRGDGGQQPEVAVDAHGHATVVWQHRGWGYAQALHAAVLMTRYSSGGWSPARVLGHGYRTGGEPLVAMNARGRTLVAWSGLAGLYPSVKARVRQPGGSWGPVRVAARGQLGEVALTAGGTSMVAWRRVVGNGNGRVGITLRRAGRPWGAGSWLSPPVVSDADTADRLMMASNPRGDVTVAWLGYVGRVIRRVDGQWGPVVYLRRFSPSRVAMDPAGRVVITSGGATVVAHGPR